VSCKVWYDEASDLVCRFPLDARITAAAKVTRNSHAFCDVKGYVSPVTQFEALLPQETWRGDYLQQGCGGLCGKADVSLDDPSRTSGYQAPYDPLKNGEMVVAADDEGHETASNADALWARKDLRLRAVFGYSSEHQLARTMKAVVRAFYGRKPAYSYFNLNPAVEIIRASQALDQLRKLRFSSIAEQLGDLLSRQGLTLQLPDLGSAGSPTAGAKLWSWRSAIQRTSTGSSPAPPPTTGRRWPVWSDPGSPRRTGTRGAGRF